MADPRMQMGSDMPFDGKRLIFDGFEAIVERRSPENEFEAQREALVLRFLY
jgi:hypothetical protein